MQQRIPSLLGLRMRIGTSLTTTRCQTSLQRRYRRSKVEVSVFLFSFIVFTVHRCFSGEDSSAYVLIYKSKEVLAQPAFR